MVKKVVRYKEDLKINIIIYIRRKCVSLFPRLLNNLIALYSPLL